MSAPTDSTLAAAALHLAELLMVTGQALGDAPLPEDHAAFDALTPEALTALWAVTA